MNYTPTAPSRLLFGDSLNRDITLYPTGNSYTLHLTRPIRNIERVELVSDLSEYEGGELQINTGKVLVAEKEKGIFPSYLLHR